MIIGKIANLNTKLFNFLKRWVKHFHGPLQDEVPWITFGAIDWLKSHIDGTMNVFEWGSGGSTLFLAHRVKHLTSIEHDHAWYHSVNKKLQYDHLTNCDLILIEPVPSPAPLAISKNEHYAQTDFSAYIHTIDAYPDNYFDLIIIDGRARSACLKQAKNKVKPGGYIMLDDSERNRYQAAIAVLDFPQQSRFYGPGPYLNFSWQTTIFKRP